MVSVAFDLDDVYFGTDLVLFGGDDGPPASPGTSPIALYYDGTEVGALGWAMEFEEVLGGIGRASAVIQDRANSEWEPEPHHDIKMTIRSSGWVIFRGETLQPSCKIGPEEARFRTWTIPCRDYNGWVSEALFGAPDGGNFWRPNDKEQYRAIDPYAVSTGSDKDTIAAWGEHYRPTIPNGEEIDWDTKVFDHGDPLQPIDQQDAMSTLGAAIGLLASLLEVNVQDWLGPDMVWRHVAIPSAAQLLVDGVADDLDEAPVAIGPLEDGHHMGLEWAWDGQAMPEQLYGQGQTGFTHEDLKADAAGASGFYPVNPDLPNVPVGQDALKRQAYLSMPSAWTRAEGIRITGHALARGEDPTLRASFSIEGIDGWRAGQVVTINDELLPISLQGSHKFVIQRVHGTLYPGTDLRHYDIDIGDGAVDRSETGSGVHADPNAAPDAAVPAKRPVITWRVEWVNDNGNPDLNPIDAGETRNVIAHTENALGEQAQPQGTVVTFGVVATDVDPDSPTFGDIIPAMGSFSPNPATTDQDGKARSVFTAGATAKLSYAPFAETELPQA